MPHHHDLVKNHHSVQGLRLLRQATANFLRILSTLDEGALLVASGIPTWRRSHLVAYLGIQARLMAEAGEALREGRIPQPELLVSATDVDVRATLPRVALHNFLQHSAVHLDVELRDLSSLAWENELFGPDGPTTMSALVWCRAEELWWAAVLLRAGQHALALPAEIRQRSNGSEVPGWLAHPS